MKRFAVVLTPLLIAACASSVQTQPSSLSSNTVAPSQPVAAAPDNAAETARIAAQQMELKKLAEDIKQLQKQSDYFDYNQAIVKPEYLDIIKKEAAFIKTHGGDVVTLEGNADERGTAEYNYELGSKRAQAVAKSLEGFGVPATQLKVVSLGEAKARLTCHEEKCWKENRRVDFNHQLN